MTPRAKKSERRFVVAYRDEEGDLWITAENKALGVLASKQVLTLAEGAIETAHGFGAELYELVPVKARRRK